MISKSLSRTAVKSLTKSTTNPAFIFNNVLSFRGSPPEAQVSPSGLTDVEVEDTISPLFDYFDANLRTLNTHLSDVTKTQLMTGVWKELLMTIEGLLIPPLSENPSDMEPLSDKEVDIVFKWLKVLNYLYSDSCADTCLTVPAGLSLCKWGGSRTAGDASKSEAS